MNTHRLQLAVCLCVSTLFMGCVANSSSQQKEKGQTEKALVGNDRDNHGCIASAGYQWSELLKDCIRPFEKGTRMKSSDEDQTTAAYMVFSNDSTKVELFLPKEKSHPILNRKTTLDGETSWSDQNEDLWSVRCIKSIWGIYYNNEIRFVKY